jgi:hypothetical protein
MNTLLTLTSIFGCEPSGEALDQDPTVKSITGEPLSPHLAVALIDKVWACAATAKKTWNPITNAAVKSFNPIRPEAMNRSMVPPLLCA